MNHELEAIFSRYNLKGSIVIHLIDKKIQIYNPERASERFTPASTFKILNTLIALEEQAISDINDIIRWDGHFYEYPSWNGDQTLASAFKGSCVWFYQELARRIGREKYKKYFEQISFGELSEQFEETNFWLDDSLKISALEQIDFLKEVYQRTLPLVQRTMTFLRKS